MLRISLLDIPQVRLVPVPLLAALREIDPVLTMIHLSDDKWVTGYLSGSGEQIARGRRALENTRRAVGNLEKKRARLPRRTAQRCHDRLLLAQFKAMGAIGCRLYQMIRPDGAIVEQVRRDDFYDRHTTESEFWRQCDVLEDKSEQDRVADLTDHARANDVHHYAHTLNHSPGTPTLASLPTPVRSGFIRHEQVA